MRNATSRATLLSLATFTILETAISSSAFATSAKCVAARLLDDEDLIGRHCKSNTQEKARNDEPGTASGSFVESCKNTRQNEWVVSARCKAKDGSWSQTSVNFKNCPNHSLTNLNGNLVCGP